MGLICDVAVPAAAALLQPLAFLAWLRGSLYPVPPFPGLFLANSILLAIVRTFFLKCTANELEEARSSLGL